MNYLRPNIKRGNITPDEDDLIIRLHSLLGNRWSLIAGRLPGRTDNEIKNYWNTHLHKKLRTQGTDPNTHKKLIFKEPAVLQDQSKIGKNYKSNNNVRKQVVKNKNKNKNKSIASTTDHDSTVEPDEKPKIHLPKPVRVTSLSMTPRIERFERGTIFNREGSCTTGFGSKVEDTWACDSKNGEIINGVGLLNDGGDQDHGLVMSCLDFDIQCQNSNLPTGEKSLEKLYEEYLELLKAEDHNHVELDAFAESCLVI